MIAIIDYGVGNLFSLQYSLKKIGFESVVTSDKKVIETADKIILPGVGAFPDAVKKLKESGLFDVVIEQAKNGKYLLGICLGMQMLFETSEEFGLNDGLGLIKGTVRAIKPLIGDLKTPHMGWNSLAFNKQSKLFKYIKDGDFVYFVHSFSAQNCDESVSAYTVYGDKLTASVENGNVYGTQFHPEKSGEVGLKILKAFCEI